MDLISYLCAEELFPCCVFAGTVRAFKAYFYDNSEHKGFFSHIDFATKSPHAESLKATNNHAKKNW